MACAWGLGLLSVGGLLLRPADGRGQSPAETPESEQGGRVVAVVNGVELLEVELQWRWAQLWPARRPTSPPTPPPGWRQRLLAALVDQELVLQYLERRALGATMEEIQRAYRQQEAQRVAWEASTPPARPSAGGSASVVRRRLAWQLGWPRYAQKYLTEERLQSYFEAHRERFDGTRVRAAQILWRAGSAEEFQRARRAATQLHQALREGQSTFEEAARSVSQSPTKEQGGEVGWIDWWGPMEPHFTQAAFALQPGELSQPFDSPFGVHLVRCLDRRPGARSFAEARPDVLRAARQALFRRLADRQRRTADIQILLP